MLGADFPRSDRFDIATSIPFSFYDYMIAQVNDELQIINSVPPRSAVTRPIASQPSVYYMHVNVLSRFVLS